MACSESDFIPVSLPVQQYGLGQVQQPAPSFMGFFNGVTPKGGLMCSTQLVTVLMEVTSPPKAQSKESPGSPQPVLRACGELLLEIGTATNGMCCRPFGCRPLHLYPAHFPPCGTQGVLRELCWFH